MNNNRLCNTCNIPKLPKKRSCYNNLCSESKIFKDKKKIEKREKNKISRENIRKKKADEKDKKRIERERKKKLRAPKAGTSVKGRDGSTRHGMVISFSDYHKKEITIEDVDNRNINLKINPDKCFWCKYGNKECGDHAMPCCNTTHSEYSHTNALNIVPSCNSCNSKKGGKRLEIWLGILVKNKLWTEEEVLIYMEWVNENKNKLLLNKEDTEFIERQFVYINKFHEICDYCAKNTVDIGNYIKFITPVD